MKSNISTTVTKTCLHCHNIIISLCFINTLNLHFITCPHYLYHQDNIMSPNFPLRKRNQSLQQHQSSKSHAKTRFQNYKNVFRILNGFLNYAEYDTYGTHFQSQLLQEQFEFMQNDRDYFANIARSSSCDAPTYPSSTMMILVKIANRRSIS